MMRLSRYVSERWSTKLGQQGSPTLEQQGGKDHQPLVHEHHVHLRACMCPGHGRSRAHTHRMLSPHGDHALLSFHPRPLFRHSSPLISVTQLQSRRQPTRALVAGAPPCPACAYAGVQPFSARAMTRFLRFIKRIQQSSQTCKPRGVTERTCTQHAHWPIYSFPPLSQTGPHPFRLLTARIPDRRAHISSRNLTQACKVCCAPLLEGCAPARFD